MNARRVAKCAVNVVAALALVAIVAVFVVQAVPGLIGAEHSYVVLSNSMAPEINPGDSVIVGSVDPATIQEGDVITFDREADQPPVTHRVVEVIRGDEGLAFRTAGDNNEGVDPGTVPAEAVIGKVWFSIPLVGHVVQFANQPAGMAVLIGVPIALLALSELWDRSGPTSVQSADAGEDGANGSVDDVLPRFEEDPADERVDPTEDGVSFSATELRLGAIGFGSFALYAAYVAVGEPTGVSVGVAVGATIAAAFHVAGLATIAFAGEEDAAGADGSAPPGNPRGGGADD